MAELLRKEGKEQPKKNPAWCHTETGAWQRLQPALPDRPPRAFSRSTSPPSPPFELVFWEKSVSLSREHAPWVISLRSWPGHKEQCLHCSLMTPSFWWPAAPGWVCVNLSTLRWFLSSRQISPSWVIEYFGAHSPSLLPLTASSDQEQKSAGIRP